MNEQYAKIVEILHALPKYGSGIGLHRTESILREQLGTDWQQHIPAIHITGSNGKGSTAEFTAALLTQLGFKTGLFTSPHLYAYNERFRVNGKAISTPDLYRLLQSGLDHIKQYENSHPDESFGRFELLFITAMRYFNEYNTDVIVLEAGIGGRYDTTRLARGSTAVLTSVDLEHAALLGDTLELIAFDKSDICSSGGKLIVGNVNESLKQKLITYNSLREVRTEFLTDISTIHNIDYTPQGMTASFIIDSMDFNSIPYSMPGAHMVGNSILAIRAVLNWLSDQNKSFATDTLQSAVHKAFAALPANGRLEKLQDTPPLYIDTAHTPDAINTLINAARTMFQDKYIILITGVSKDKNIASIINLLGSIAHTAICTRAQHKGSGPENIQSVLQQAFPNLSNQCAYSVRKALDIAQKISTKHNNSVILAAGGLFLAAETKAIIENRDLSELTFF